MRRLKVGIRTQLIVLVTFASLFSLLILATVCGFYYSSNLSNLRAERLEVISQLKSSQVTQAINYLSYQVYYLTTIDTITNPLTNYRAGNNSLAVFDDAQSSLDQFLTSSESFAAAKLYNLDLKVVAESSNNNTLISAPAADYLYPLQQNLSIPSPISHLNNSIQSYYFSGPVSNSSDPNASYFVGLTYAVYANTSIILSTPSLAGYLSVLTSADNIQVAVNSSAIQSSNDYQVIAYSPVFESNNTDDTASDKNLELIGFQSVFPVENSKSLQSNNVYNINQSTSAKDALTHDAGSSTNKRNVDGNEVALGYCKVQIDPTTSWSIAIEQKKSIFNGPVNRLKNIIIGVSIGVGAFMCLITFPLAVYFIRPITRLKDATEAITRLKREKEKADLLASTNSSPSDSPPPPPYYSTLIRRMTPYNQNNNQVEKQSLLKSDKKNRSSNVPSAGSHENTGIVSLGGTGASAAGGDKRDIEMEELPKRELKLRHRDKRNSIFSSGTGGSNSVYSTGIRLPSKITNQKSFFKDELAELTDAFNIMREELEKQYVHLEDRVRSRTKELEASKIEAEAANEAKTVFIANISHELRTPLNGILGMTSIAMEENEVGTIKDSLKLINRSGELLLHILTELLTYSKNTLNRSKLEKSSFQILEIVYQVQSIFNKLAHDQRVYFKILVKPNSFRKLILYGDSNRIIQVVMNLVSNALKFTPVEGKVDVTFKLLGEYDEQKSKTDNYESVHTKNYDGIDYDHHNTSGDTDVENNNFNIDINKDINKDNDKDLLKDLSKHDNNTSLNGLDSRRDDDDVASLYTLSTQEYDKVIFQSQFAAATKPLPKVPEGAESDSSSDGSHKFNNNNENNNNGNNGGNVGGLDISDDSSEDKFHDVNEHPQLLPPPNMRQKSNNSNTTNGNSTSPNNQNNTSTTSSTKRPSINSLDSLNSNELVKNNKVYKIKNLYKPKTWVLQIQVTDTGPGIEPALQEKVFEPFIQGDQTLSRSYGGTGLGLAICRQLAKMMKGTLALKSTLGVGSTFVFTVPLPQVGEILVPETDMVDFAEDEFNPKSKANRKVAFAFDDESIEINDHNAPGSPFKDPSSSFNNNKNSSDESVSGQPFSTSSPNNDNNGNNKLITMKRSNEDVKKPTPAFIEKPRLVTRSSTGTANSSSGSDRDRHSGNGNGNGHGNGHGHGLDKLELPSNDLLDHLSHLKILVAEDNMVNQEVIKRMLSLEGFVNITMASNGAEAVDYVKTSIENDELYDLIFMDVQMPKIDGLLATKMIRGNLNYSKPIIALTAFADESNVKECLNSGMSGFLSKPIRRTNLRKIITEYAPTLLNDATSPNIHGNKRLGH